MPRDSIPATDAAALKAAGLARRLELTAEYLRAGKPVLAWGMMEGAAEDVQAMARAEIFAEKRHAA